MRFYVKLILTIAFCTGLTSTTARRMMRNLAYEARCGWVYRFGTDAEIERLIEDTGRMLAAERGCLDSYLANERFRKQLAVRRHSTNHCAWPAHEGFTPTNDRLSGVPFQAHLFLRNRCRP